MSSQSPPKKTRASGQDVIGPWPIPTLKNKIHWETLFWRPLCKIMGKCIRKYFILELCYLGKITRYFQGLLSSVAIFLQIRVCFFLFTCCYVNTRIKTSTENLPTQPGSVLAIRTDILSNFVEFVQYVTFLARTEASMI